MPHVPSAAATAPGGLSLRPVTDADRPFLYQVYASTREEELAPVPWTPQQKEAFLRMQFEAQSRDYQANYADASFDLVLLDGEPVGRFCVLRRPREITVIDIALLPPGRGRGIGAYLLGGLIEEGGRSGRPVVLTVEKFNRARRLYERLGFVHEQDLGVYDLLLWRPAAQA